MPKLTNEHSFLAAKSQDKKKQEERFYEQVEKLKDKSLGIQFFEKGSEFHRWMNDKTLEENKGPLHLEAERNLLSQLLKLAEQMDEDENEKTSGSVALSVVVLKSLLLLRNRLNELEYHAREQTNKPANPT